MTKQLKSDDLIESAHADEGTEIQKLKSLAGVKLSPPEAQEVWPQLLEHKWYLSERLGKDVGLKVAAIDYFENVRRVTKRDEIRDTLPPILPFMRPLSHK